MPTLTIEFPGAQDPGPKSPPWRARDVALYFADHERRRAERAELITSHLRRVWDIPFYRTAWARAGVPRPSTITSETLSQLPPVSGADLAAACASQPPFGGTVHTSQLQKVVLGRSEPPGTALLAGIPTTTQSRSLLASFAARAWDMAGLRSANRVQISAGYSVSGDGWIAEWGAEYLGASIVPAGGESATPPRRQLDFMRRFGVTAVYGPVATLMSIAGVAHADGAVLAMPSLKLIVTPDGCGPADRERLRSTWDADVYSVFSVGGWLAAECAVSADQDGRLGMHVWTDVALLEVLDRQGRPCPSGAVGEIVATSWTDITRPIVRMRTGTYGRLADDPCGCGLATPRLIVEPAMKGA